MRSLEPTDAVSAMCFVHFDERYLLVAAADASAPDASGNWHIPQGTIDRDREGATEAARRLFGTLLNRDIPLSAVRPIGTYQNEESLPSAAYFMEARVQDFLTTQGLGHRWILPDELERTSSYRWLLPALIAARKLIAEHPAWSPSAS